MKTFKDLRDEFLAIAAEVGSTGLTATQAGHALNNAHEERCTGEDWGFMLWRNRETISVTAGLRYASLHPLFSRPYYFYNRTEKDWVREVPLSQLAASSLDFIDGTGPVRWFQYVGRSPVSAQPSSASTLAVTSSAPGDGAQQTVTVLGETADGVVEETIACGETGTEQFTHILKVRKSGTWDGTMSLAAGGTTLLKLRAGERGRSHQQIWFPESPDSPSTLEYKFYRLPFRMVEDDDIPDIPPPFSTILLYDALLLNVGTLRPPAVEVEVWKAQQDRILFNMRRANAEAMTLETLPTYTTYIDRS